MDSSLINSVVKVRHTKRYLLTDDPRPVRRFVPSLWVFFFFSPQKRQYLECLLVSLPVYLFFTLCHDIPEVIFT